MIESLELLGLDEKLREMEPVFASDANVHDIAGRVGTWAQAFIDADNAHLTGINAGGIDFATVKQQILATCNSSPEYQRLYLENVTKVLNNIEGHGVGNSPETNLPLQTMLIRAWSLKDLYSNGEGIILQNLHANIADHGGCVPGISVRLAQPYAAFVYAQLKRQYEAGCSNVANQYRAPELSQEELSRVLQESMFTHAQQEEQQLRTLEEEHLSKALAESL